MAWTVAIRTPYTHSAAAIGQRQRRRARQALGQNILSVRGAVRRGTRIRQPKREVGLLLILLEVRTLHQAVHYEVGRVAALAYERGSAEPPGTTA